MHSLILSSFSSDIEGSEYTIPIRIIIEWYFNKERWILQFKEIWVEYKNSDQFSVIECIW